jgi:hypothetical protein
MNQEQRVPVRELIFLALGEAITAGLIITAFLVLKKFDYTVVTGAVLGSLVIVLNFVFLCTSVNRAFDKTLADVDVEKLRAAAKAVDNARESGDENAEEENSEALDKITEPNGKRLSNAIRVSYLLRTVTMLAALVVALVTKQFNVIATAIPLFMQRPLLTLAELTKKKKEG